MKTITSYLFYFISLITLFFNGIDSSLLYQSAFLVNDKYTLFNYFHYAFSIIAGWGIGYFFIKKLIYNYNLNYVLRISFLLSSISLFIQYQRHHFMQRPFEQIIVDNLLCYIVLSVLYYSLMRLSEDKNLISHFKKQKKFFFIISILGFFYSELITQSNLESAFIANGLFYFIAYIFFLFFNVNKLDLFQEINIKKLFISMLIFILVIGLLLFFNLLISFKSIAEESYMLYINLIFILLENFVFKFFKK